MGGVSPSEKSDQYSFGVMLYNALTKRMPLSYEQTGGNKLDFAKEVYAGELLPDFGLLRKKVNPELASIIEKCMSFDPKDRYDSMQDVENELVRLMKNGI